MAWRYPYLKHIIGRPAVDGGQCVRLVQHYIPEIGHTSTWDRGEQVIKSMHLARGMAIANFTQAGNWPTRRNRFLHYHPDARPRQCGAGISHLSSLSGRRENQRSTASGTTTSAILIHGTMSMLSGSGIAASLLLLRTLFGGA